MGTLGQLRLQLGADPTTKHRETGLVRACVDCVCAICRRLIHRGESAKESGHALVHYACWLRARRERAENGG